MGSVHVASGGGHDEGDPVHVGSAKRIDHRSDTTGVLRSPEGDRAGHRLDRPGPEGQDQHVVTEPSAFLRLDHVRVGQYVCERVAVHSHAAVGADRGEREPLHPPRHERLGDGQRTVGEMPLGGQQLDGGAVAGERLEREHRLEAGDPAAGHDDADRVGVTTLSIDADDDRL